MPRKCSVCTHKARKDIDKMLVAEVTYRTITYMFSITRQTLIRHKKNHIPAFLLKSKETEEIAQAETLMDELRSYQKRVKLLFDACDRWLRDPKNPDQYDLSPRETEVNVVYTELVNGKPVAKKERLSILLRQIKKSGKVPMGWEYKHADPRVLILKTANSLNKQLELLAQLSGELEKHIKIHIEASPEWIQLRTTILRVIEPFPEVRVAMLRAFEDAHAHN